MPAEDFKPKLPGFLAVPSKVTKLTDWKDQLRLCLSTHDNAIPEAEEKIVRFQKMRNDCMDNNHITLGGLGILYNYLMQLDSLQQRFTCLNKPEKLSFCWFDAFDKVRSVEQSSLAFEKANVAFNIGALLSQLGAKDSQEEAAGGAQSFQAASGVFKWISETFLHPPLVDIQGRSLAFLTALMGAQAQECVLRKAMTEGKSPGTLAKLAAALQAKYEKCSGSLQSPDAEEFNESLSQDCRALVHGKCWFYAAVREYYMAVHCTMSERMGEALGRLNHAHYSLEELGKIGSAGRLFELDAFYEELKLRFPKWEHENDFIHHQKILQFSQLPAIEAVDLTKVPACLKDLMADLGVTRYVAEDVFARVLPSRVLQESSRYSEEKSKILRYEKAKCQAAEEELALLRTKAERIGGDSLALQYNRLMRELEEAGDRSSIEHADGLLRACERKFEEIARFQTEDSAMLQQFRAMYGEIGLAPLDLNGLAEYKERVNAAQNIVHRALGDYEARVQSHLQSAKLDDALKKELLGFASTAGGCEEHLRELIRLEADRARDLEELKTKILEDDIGEKILKHQGDPAELFDRELRKFDGMCDRIEASLGQHKDLAQAIQREAVGHQGAAEQRWRELGLEAAQERVQAAKREKTAIEDTLKALDLEGLHAAVDGVLQATHRAVAQRASEAETKGRLLEQDSAFQTQRLLREKLAALSTTSSTDRVPSLPANQPEANDPARKPSNEPSLLD